MFVLTQLPSDFVLSQNITVFAQTLASKEQSQLFRIPSVELCNLPGFRISHGAICVLAHTSFVVVVVVVQVFVGWTGSQLHTTAS